MSGIPYYVQVLRSIKAGPYDGAIRVRDWIRECKEARKEGRPVVGFAEFKRNEEKKP